MHAEAEELSATEQKVFNREARRIERGSSEVSSYLTERLKVGTEGV